MPSFGEDDLQVPIHQTLDAVKAHVTGIHFDGEAKTIIVTFTKGEGTGANYVARFDANATFRNIPANEQGQGAPADPQWTNFVTGTEIADYCIAQGSITNGAVLKRLAQHLLQTKGII